MGKEDQQFGTGVTSTYGRNVMSLNGIYHVVVVEDLVVVVVGRRAAELDDVVYM